MRTDVTIVDCGMCTALGPDTARSWQGLLSGETAIREVTRFDGRHAGKSWPVAACSGVGYSSRSMLMQMLLPMLRPLSGRLPKGALILLATTVGEVDLLEEAQVNGGSADAGRFDATLRHVSEALGLARTGCVVSCACASSSMAMALGAGLVRDGIEKDVVVVGGDAVSEFVLAGFAGLAALAPEPARPFDKDRQGLSLGEAAGWCWLSAESRATARGRILGWSCRADAHHMTAPHPRGAGLAAATGEALAMAGLRPADIGAICAHGTGTRYNDDMEVAAFAAAFAPAVPPPIFSVKGHIGHTLGAAGIVEAIAALEAARSRCAPPTAGCRQPDPEGTPVTRGRVTFASPFVLSTNSGFGGVNTALVLDAGPRAAELRAPDQSCCRVELAGLSWSRGGELGVAAGEGSPVTIPMPPMDAPGDFFRGGYKNWGRVSPVARRLAFALEHGARGIGLGLGDGTESPWGIFGLNATGSHAENIAFFRDYLDNGRGLSRGALFVQTLPSTAVAEASIHFRLSGPACHFVDPGLDTGRLLDWGCATLARGGPDGLVIAVFQDDLVICAFLKASRAAGVNADAGAAGALRERLRERLLRSGVSMSGIGNCA